MKAKTKKYLAYFFCIAIFFFWIGTLCGAGLTHYKLEKQSNEYRIEMVKDSLYYEYIKLYNGEIRK